MHHKVILMILDGWGIGRKDYSDAIHLANTPFIDSLYSKVPNCQLTTFGEKVGLPKGQMGNSEVGHLNIGAGRIVYQMLMRINKAFEDKSILHLEAIQEIIKLGKSGKNIHLIGLVSDGGVHSSLEHLLSLLELLKSEALDSQTFIHVFTDGRDTDPKSGINFIQQLEQYPAKGLARIATISGRYFAMDRDKRWERVRLAYNAMVNGKGKHYTSASEAINTSYEQGVTDEFIVPAVISDHPENANTICEGDVVFSFNFRTDRAREITQVLTQSTFPKHEMRPLQLHYFTMTEYDKTFEHVHVVFNNEDLRMTLGEFLSKKGFTQLRAAETEKYPHVTFFFSGGREEPFPGEDRLLIPSPKVATYDLQPEMSAFALKDGILKAIDKNNFDFMCINFANPDMVGHTGVFPAIVKAAEVVDQCSSEIVEKGLLKGYRFVIIADHGNADYAINADGSPNTAHSLNPVPCFFIGVSDVVPHNGILADVAPSILKIMGLPQAAEMTGSALF